MLRNAVILLLLTGISLQAQTPNISNGLPAESFAGEPFSFTLNWDNTGSPGFGPYYRLILPLDITLDSASFLGTGITIEDLGVFPAAPGNTIADPR